MGGEELETWSVGKPFEEIWGLRGAEKKSVATSKCKVRSIGEIIAHLCADGINPTEKKIMILGRGRIGRVLFFSWVWVLRKRGGYDLSVGRGQCASINKKKGRTYVCIYWVYIIWVVINCEVLFWTHLSVPTYFFKQCHHLRKGSEESVGYLKYKDNAQNKFIWESGKEWIIEIPLKCLAALRTLPNFKRYRMIIFLSFQKWKKTRY